MRSAIRSSLFWKYAACYACIVLIACSLLGYMLISASTDALSRAMENSLTERLNIASADLENQFEICRQISYKISATIYYMPYYTQRGDYYETDLIADLAKYKDYSTLFSNYFFMYKGANCLYYAGAKSYVSAYFSAFLGISDSESIIRQFGDDVRLLPLSPNDSFLLCCPIRLKESARRQEAYVCFVLKAAEIEKRCIISAGEFEDGISVYYGDIPLCGQGATANAPRGASAHFSVYTEPPISGFSALFKTLTGSARLYALACAVSVCAVVLLLSYFTYLPIRRITARHAGKETSPREGNELQKIDWLLTSSYMRADSIRKSRDELTGTIKAQYETIREQMTLLLISGEYSHDMDDQFGSVFGMRPTDARACAVAAIRGSEERVRECAEKLIALAQGMHMPGVGAGAVYLRRHDAVAVALLVKEEALARDAAARLQALARQWDEGFWVSLGYICRDPRELLGSQMVALSMAQGSQSAGAQNWYDDHEIQAMLSDVEAGRAQSALFHAGVFMRAMKEKTPSMLARRCVYIDVLNSLFRIACARNSPVSDEQAARALMMEDDEAFAREIEARIRALTGESGTALIPARGQKVSADEIIEYVRANLLNYEMTLGRLEDVFHASGKHISGLIRTRTGMGYKEYVTHLRIERAKEMLSQGDDTVAGIADALLFSGSPHFVRVFKQETGVTPAEYRRQSKAPAKG